MNEILALSRQIIRHTDPPKILAFVGDRGQGKTHNMLKVIGHYRFPTLIIDRNYQDNYDNIDGLGTRVPFIKETALANWNKENIFRVGGRSAVQNVYDCIENQKNNKSLKRWRGLVVFEDSGTYLRGKENIDLAEDLCGAVRHTNYHLFFVFHSLSQIPQQIAFHINGIVLFKTGDDLAYLKKYKTMPKKDLILNSFSDLSDAPDHEFAYIELR